MRKTPYVVAALVMVFAVTAFAQKEDVRLFQSFYEDAPILKKNFVHPLFTYSSFENWSVMTVGAIGGHPFTPKVDLQAGLHYVSSSPDKGDGQSGISDLDVVGRYNIKKDKVNNFSVGGYASLPIGSDKVGYSKFNFGGFGAYRNQMKSGMVITATAGLYFIEVPDYGDVSGLDADDFNFAKAAADADDEVKTKHETQFRIGGGVIYPVNKQLNIVGELALRTKIDFMMLSGGVDYAMKNGGRLRGALGIGLDDGAPDLMILAGYMLTLK
jgi:hypothetical protein